MVSSPARNVRKSVSPISSAASSRWDVAAMRSGEADCVCPTDQFVECTNKIEAATVRKLARDWKS
jgi:hypothetical protein